MNFYNKDGRLMALKYDPRTKQYGTVNRKGSFTPRDPKPASRLPEGAIEGRIRGYMKRNPDWTREQAEAALQREFPNFEIPGELDQIAVTPDAGPMSPGAGRKEGNLGFPGEEAIPGGLNPEGMRPSDALTDPVKNELGQPGLSGHLGAEDYAAELDMVEGYLANPYWEIADANRRRAAKGLEPLDIDPETVGAMSGNQNRHQFIRITGRGEGKPDIIVNRIVKRDPTTGLDAITHQGWMTPNAYNNIARQGEMLGGIRGGGLKIDDMPVMTPDGSLYAGRAGNRELLRGPGTYPERAGGGRVWEPLQERKRHFKIRIKRR